ncbi:hypothetical protein N8I84_42000 (plasmid) [Streptomyces cynarae]|uniref:HEAT repeat domain-containing protein n=1 Tax=Streptomyces cynarae TaxID=2981134 RepID=A0ABY6EEL6_9ACTN|nr:hypothetical protein [Streptomyces cynarae]UXY25005.1 hypothetical protein N8I84_42000 [Streptomyces cynarae]
MTPEESTHIDTFTGTTSSFSRTASAKVAAATVVRQSVFARAPWPDATLAKVTTQTAWEAAHFGEKPRFLLRIGLLDWLGRTAADANEEVPGGLQADIEAFRALRPALHDVIRPFLTDDERQIREAALAALLPLLTAPELAHHRADLRDAVRALAAAEATPYRHHAVGALASWDEDTTSFPQEPNSATDAGTGAEGFAEDPPF